MANPIAPLPNSPRTSGLLLRSAGVARAGLSAPEIIAFDLAAGLAIVEDLGCEPIACGGAIIEERYAVALAGLAYLHSASVPDTCPSMATRPIGFQAMTPMLCRSRSNCCSSGTRRLSLALTLPRAPRRPLYCLAPNSLGSPRHAAGVDVARLSFAKPTLACRARRHCQGRRPGFPGLCLGPSSIRCRLPPAGRPRRCSATLGIKTARPLRALAARRTRAFDRRVLPVPMPFWVRSVRRRSLAFSRASMSATISRSTLRTCPGSKNIWPQNLTHPALAELKLWYEEHLPRIFGRAR